MEQAKKTEMILALKVILAEMDRRSKDESLPLSNRQQYAIKHAKLYRYLIQVEDTVYE